MINTNELQVFDNQEFGQIRTVVINNEPWFVGKDVAGILGYAAERNAIAAHVDDEDKLTHQISASGQMREVTIINESGLYSLILSSKLPTAKQFKHWVTSDVLPAIRKTGKYTMPSITPNPHYRTRMIGTAVRDIGKTAESIAKVFKVKTGMAMASAMAMVGEAYGIDTSPLRTLLPSEDNPGYMNATAVAEKVGVLTSTGKGDPAKMNKLLESKGLQRKEGKDWRLNDTGREYGEEKPYHKHGHSGYSIAWNDKVIDALQVSDE